MSKTIEPSINSWIRYVTNVQDSVGRVLTKKEISSAMQGYITGKDWNSVAEGMK